MGGAGGEEDAWTPDWRGAEPIIANRFLWRKLFFLLALGVLIIYSTVDLTVPADWGWGHSNKFFLPGKASSLQQTTERIDNFVCFCHLIKSNGVGPPSRSYPRGPFPSEDPNFLLCSFGAVRAFIWAFFHGELVLHLRRPSGSQRGVHKTSGILILAGERPHTCHVAHLSLLSSRIYGCTSWTSKLLLPLYVRMGCCILLSGGRFRCVQKRA